MGCHTMCHTRTQHSLNNPALALKVVQWGSLPLKYISKALYTYMNKLAYNYAGK